MSDHNFDDLDAEIAELEKTVKGSNVEREESKISDLGKSNLSKSPSQESVGLKGFPASSLVEKMEAKDATEENPMVPTSKESNEEAVAIETSELENTQDIGAEVDQAKKLRKKRKTTRFASGSPTNKRKGIFLAIAVAAIFLITVLGYLFADKISKHEAKNNAAYSNTQGESSSGNIQNRSALETEIKAEIKRVVYEYARVKVRGLSNLNNNAWKEILIDPILEKERRSTCGLKKNGLRYTFSDQHARILDVTLTVDHKWATVIAEITENRGTKRIDGEVYQVPQRSQYKAIYELVRQNGKWYIYCLQALNKGDRIECKVDLRGENPCRH